MKKSFKSAVIFLTAILSALSVCSCKEKDKTDTEILTQSTVSETSQTPLTSDGTSAVDGTVSEVKPDTKQNSSEISDIQQSSKENSDTQQSSSESSDTKQNSSESSDTSKSSQPKEVSQQSKTESQVSKTEESSEESENSEEVSVEESSQAEGYYFDDEQIVTDYHTAQTFTDNEEFNELFKNNDIDKVYDSELKEVGSISEMRQITTEYADKWKEQSEKAYEELYELLWDNEGEQRKLEESQQAWKDGIQKVEEDFYNQASEEALEGGLGSQTLLSADTAMMNYYKGRAAVLYQQIFLLTNKFEITVN